MLETGTIHGTYRDISTYACVHTCIHTYMHTCMRTYTHIYVHTYMYTHVSVCTHADMQAHTNQVRYKLTDKSISHHIAPCHINPINTASLSFTSITPERSHHIWSWHSFLHHTAPHRFTPHHITTRCHVKERPVMFSKLMSYRIISSLVLSDTMNLIPYAMYLIPCVRLYICV